MKTKTKCLKDPTYAIFSESRGFKDIKYHILSSQPVNFSLVNQTRPDQDREDFNLADLILELVSSPMHYRLRGSIGF